MSTTDQIIIKILAEDVNFEKTIKDLKQQTANAEKEATANAKKLAAEQEKQAERVKKAWKTIGTSMAVVGTAASTALGFAAKAAIDYESAFAGVNKTMDLTIEQQEMLEQRFKNMSQTMPDSASELAKIAEIGGQLGVGVDNIEKFTEVISKFGVAQSALDSEQASLTLAQFLNVMDGGTDNIEQTASAVINLGNNTATTEDKIMMLAKRIAPTAKLIGISKDEVLGLSAGISQLGIEPEAAGTAMQNFLLGMNIAAKDANATIIDNTKDMASYSKKINDTSFSLENNKKKLQEMKDAGKEGTAAYDKVAHSISQAESELGEYGTTMQSLESTHGQAIISQGKFAEVLGVSNEEFKKMQQTDPTGTYIKFLNGLKQIDEEGGNVANVLDELDAGQARSIRTILAQAGAIEKMESALVHAKKGYEEINALDIEYEKRLKTTQAQMDIFKNNINVAAISLGNALLPAINSIMQALIPLINGFSDFAEEHPRVVIGILGVVAVIGSLSGAIMVLTPVISAFGTIIASVIGPTAMAAITGGLTTFIGVLGSITGVVTLVVGVFSLVTLAFDELFYQLGITGERMEFVRDLFSTSKIIFEELGSKASDFAEKLFGISGATRDIKLSEEELQNARNNRKQLENEMLTAMENTQLLRIRAKEATDDVTEAEEKYGEGSDEYIKAVINKDRTIRELEQSYIDSNKKIDEFNANEETLIGNSPEVQKSLEDTGKMADLVGSFWDNLGLKIGGVNGQIAEFIANKAAGFGMDAILGSVGIEKREHGGIVPGPIGAPVPMIAHGGERITPRTGVDTNQSTNGGEGKISITFNGPVNMDSDDRVNQLAKMIEQRLGRQSELSQFGVALN